MGALSFDRLVLDNPILTKHRRSRLRRTSVVPGATIVGVLCLLIGWFGVMIPGAFHNGVVFGFATSLQGIILVIIGASQIANAVGKVRESNILDFHRISPLPPFEIALGFFLGGPILEYVLWLIPAPLAAYAAVQGAPGFVDFLQVEAGQLLVAWAFHGLALLTSLMAKKPKANVGGMIAFMFIVFGQLSPFLFAGAGRLQQDPMIGFFGIKLPWLLFLAIYAISALVFELIAATRKMRTERAHAFSKPEAIAFVTAVATLVLGGFWDVQGWGGLAVGVLYILVAIGALSSITITPDANEYAKGLRRAQRAGHRRLPAWDDLALNRVTVMILSLIVLVGATIAWNVMDHAAPFAAVNPRGNVSLTIAIGVLTVAYFGLAYQVFALAFPKRPGTMLGLFLFFIWVVPMLAGAIAAAASLPEQVFTALLCLSPILGLAMSAGVGPGEMAKTAQIAALVPAIVYFFLFNNLVTVFRRRVERSVQVGPVKPKVEAVEPDALAVG